MQFVQHGKYTTQWEVIEMFKITATRTAALCGAIAFLAAGARAQPSATLALETNTAICYQTNDDIYVSVVLSQQSVNVNGVEYHLQYDQTVLDYVTRLSYRSASM